MKTPPTVQTHDILPGTGWVRVPLDPWMVNQLTSYADLEQHVEDVLVFYIAKPEVNWDGEVENTPSYCQVLDLDLERMDTSAALILPRPASKYERKRVVANVVNSARIHFRAKETA